MNKDFNIKNNDISYWIAYCIYDCYCMLIADKKCDLFQSLYKLTIQDTENPFSFAFMNKQATNILQKLIKSYV